MLLSYRLGLEKVFELIIRHSLTRILDSNFHIVLPLRGRYTHAPPTLCELAGIVGECIQHEERQHLIGLDHSRRRRHLEVDTFHLERGAPLGEEIKKRLQGETLNFQTKLALTQLNPVGQHIVVVVNLIGQLVNVCQITLLGRSHLVKDAIDEGRDAIDERYLCTLFKIAALTALYAQELGCQFLFLQIEEVVIRILVAVLAVHVIEEPQRENQQQDGGYHSSNHDVKLYGRLLVLAGTSLELTVLASGLL